MKYRWFEVLKGSQVVVWGGSRVRSRKRNEIQNNIYWKHSQEALQGTCVEYYIFFYDSLERIKQGGRINTSREKWKNSTVWWKNSRLRAHITVNSKEVRERKSARMLRIVNRCHSGTGLIDSPAEKLDWLPRGPQLPADRPLHSVSVCKGLMVSPIIA